MKITYYLAGLLSGISIASFFIGKELYRFYLKSKVQEKKMSRLSKLNDKINKSLENDSAELSD